MNRLYDRIRHEYKLLLPDKDSEDSEDSEDFEESKGPNDITLIEWCIQHDYIQQALTLYTERVPEIFYSYNLVTLTNTGKEAFKKKFSKDKTRLKGFQLYTVFSDKDWEETSQQFVDEHRMKSYCPLLEAEIEKLILKIKNDKKNDFSLEAIHNVESYINKLSEAPETGLVGLDDRDSLVEGFTLIQKLCQTPGKVMTGEVPLTLGEQAKLKLLKDVYFSNLNHNNSKFNSLKPYQQGTKLVDWTSHLNGNDLLDFFSDFSNAYSNRLIHLKECGWIQLNLPEDALRQLLDQYGEIKDKRNNTNHARKDHQLSTLEDIKTLLTEYVENIKEVCYPLHVEKSKSKSESHEENGTA